MPGGTTRFDAWRVSQVICGDTSAGVQPRRIEREWESGRNRDSSRTGWSGQEPFGGEGIRASGEMLDGRQISRKVLDRSKLWRSEAFLVGAFLPFDAGLGEVTGGGVIPVATPCR